MGEIVRNGTLFIDNLEFFMKRLILTLDEVDREVFISGSLENIIYKTILDSILNSKQGKNCSIIIPFVTSSGIISRNYINKIIANGGHVRINSQFRKDIIIIGNNAFILSFSSKYNKQSGIKTYFESCIQTDNEEVVEMVCESFMSGWKDSLPLGNEG